MKIRIRNRAIGLIAAMVVLVAASTQLNADTGICGGGSITLPFTDVSSSNVFFCSIAEAYLSGLSNGTTMTTYQPSANVPREQMAAFVSRAMDQSVKRAGKRAALDQFWTNQGGNGLALTEVGIDPLLVKSDGADLWVADHGTSTVSRVRASDGKLLETCTGAGSAYAVLIAMGKVFVTGASSPIPGQLYQIDPTQPSGPVTLLSMDLPVAPIGIAFDGQRIWTANNGEPGGGSVSIITLNPFTVTTVTAEFFHPGGILYDGANIWVTDWVTDEGGRVLQKLDSNGAVLQTVPLAIGTNPGFPAFDGTNIWAPNAHANSVSVVRAAGGLSGTVLVTNAMGNSVSVWKATDLTPIGTFGVGAAGNPFGVCSDGVNFWITFPSSGMLARF
jgi:hypothetical protein